MLKELKFVNGAVAKKDLIEGMTHFAIENNTIRSYNGRLAICAPLPFDINCKPKASQLISVIAKCTDEHPVVISLTEGGKLRIQNGPYLAYVQTTEEATPHVSPEGNHLNFDGADLLEAFKTILPFIGTDAARPWANGVLLRGRSCYATNNVCVVEYWLGPELPFTLNIPREAITEIIRVGENPTSAQLDESSITFHFSDGSWIRTQLYSTTWPEVSKIFEVEDSATDIDPNIFKGLEAITPFVDKMHNVHFRDGKLATSLSDKEGASYELVDFPHKGCYSLPMLKLLEGVATRIDWSTYPGPCIFYGSMLRGAIIGRHIQEGPT